MLPKTAYRITPTRIVACSIAFLCLLCSYGARSEKTGNDQSTNHLPEACSYYNQTPPGDTPELFAPEVLSLENAVHGVIAFHPNCNEIYWIMFPPSYADNSPPIQYVINTNGRWSEPMIFEHTREHGAINVAISPDGTKLFFDSNRPWPDSWGKQPGQKSFDSYKNWICERDGLGDLYISFRKPGGAWTQPINMGPKINTAYKERFPSVSPNGRYLFLNSNRPSELNEESIPDGPGNVFWADAGIIDDLRIGVEAGDRRMHKDD